MKREDLSYLAAFLAVAEERSFTRAAAKLGTSQSALSHTVKRLEETLGLRLLMRTTRSVAPTEAGERLIETLRPSFDEIDNRLAQLSELKDRPAGTIRVNASFHAAETILWPALAKLLPENPEIKVEVTTETQFTDIVAERYDAGVRLGEHVAQDMVAVRIGPDLRMVVVASPAYLAKRPKPKTPHDLTQHACINMRLSPRGGVYAWEFERDGRPLNVRVDGQLVFNDSRMVLTAAIAGVGLGFVMEDRARPALADGRLVQVLKDWCPTFPGYHLYYPSRRHASPAFALLVERLRYRERKPARR
jgi:DNA-binding transcriptional LysR family regulator